MKRFSNFSLFHLTGNETVARAVLLSPALLATSNNRKTSVIILGLMNKF